MKKEPLLDELDKRSPLLRDLKQDNDGFRVPEGYFEAVEDSVFSRIDAAGVRRKPALESRTNGLFARLLRSSAVWAAAAAITLVLATIWIFRPKPALPENQVATAPDLTEEDIEAYVLENIRDFEAEQLAALPVGEHDAPANEMPPAPETKSEKSSPIDDLSEEELDILLKEMSDEELENLLKT